MLLSILTPLFLPSWSVSLAYFILAVPMREYLEKYSCMSFPFPIANGTFPFRSVKAMNNWKRSAIKQILLTTFLVAIVSFIEDVSFHFAFINMSVKIMFRFASYMKMP